MKWTKTELLQLKNENISFDEDIIFAKECFQKNPLLLGLENIHVSGNGYFGYSNDIFEVDLEISGDLICPCAITNEEVIVPFETEAHESFSFVDTDDVDVHIVKNEIIEMIPIIFELITFEIPLKVVKEGEINYPSGDGWRVISEKDFERALESQIDPRLAKLKDFKFNND